MTRRDDDTGQALLAMLREVGVTDGRIIPPGGTEGNKRHPRVEGTYQGRRVVHTYPASSSDVRATLNALQDLRRQLRALGADVGPLRGWRGPGRGRERNRAPPRAVVVPKAPVMDDWREKLRAMTRKEE